MKTMKKKVAAILSVLMMAGALFGGCGVDTKYTFNKDLSSTVSTAMYYTKEELKEALEISNDNDFDTYVRQSGMEKVEKDGTTYYAQKIDQTLTKEEFEQQLGRIDENCLVIYTSSYGYNINDADTGSVSEDIDMSEMENLMKQISFMNLQMELPFTVAKSNVSFEGNTLTADALNSAGMEDPDIVYAVADENLLKGTNLTISGASEGKYYKKKQTVKIDTTDGVIRSMSLKINGKASPFSDEKHPYNVTVCSGDGRYTVFAELFSGTKQTLKFTIDKTKPTSNIKNGKTYKSGKKITFSDKTSGIKSAKLDGKTVKSGKVIKKKGTHKLVLTDKAGNKTTIKFKIK